MNVFSTIGIYLVAAAGTLVLGLAARWYDRKLTAAIQYRKGPPWYQPLADVLKLFYKETLMPTTARATGFLAAPAVALAAAGLAAAMLWAPLVRPDGSFVGDLIVVVYLLLIPPLMTILGASASGSAQAAVGASREMKLILAYELPFVLALLVGIVHAGWTLKLGAFTQNAAGPALYSISGGLAAVVMLLAVQAKLGQVPFDVAEAECEIMSGVYVEYSGPPLGVVYLTRSVLLAAMPLLVILVFWGGLQPTPLGVAAFAGKYLLLTSLVTLVRNTNPRLRIDQAMRFFWWGLTPLAVLAAILAVAGSQAGVSWL